MAVDCSVEVVLSSVFPKLALPISNFVVRSNPDAQRRGVCDRDAPAAASALHTLLVFPPGAAATRF